MRATLKARDGYRILKHYNNRVIELSSFDDGIAFERRVVPATLDEDVLVFEVPLRATKPGRHPINGIIRGGYIHGTDEMAMVSMRLLLVGAAAPALAAADVTEFGIDAGGNRARAAIRRQL